MPDNPRSAPAFGDTADGPAGGAQSQLPDKRSLMRFERDVAVVGGCGHVGLPLGLAFADRGLKVTLFDVNVDAIATVTEGRMPFLEKGADEVLRRVIGSCLTATTAPDQVGKSEYVVVVIGTPVDEHLNPDPPQCLGS